MSGFIFPWWWHDNIVRARQCRAPTVPYNYAVFQLVEEAEKFSGYF
jgi:hypothetical protein